MAIAKFYRSYVFGPAGLNDYVFAMSLLHCAAKFDPFLSLDCPPTRRNPRKGRDQLLPSGNLALHIDFGSGMKFVRSRPVESAPISR